MSYPDNPMAINLARIALRLVADPRGWMVDSLKDELGIKTRTYRKYRKVLQDHLETYMDKQGRVRIVEIEDGESKYLRLVEVDEPEEYKRLFTSRLVSLYLAQHMFAFLEGTELKQSIGDIYAEVLHRIKDKSYVLGHFFRNLDRIFYFIPDAPKDYSQKDETIKSLTTALLFCRQIKFEYNPAVGKAGSHICQPLSLILYKSALFLVVRYPDSKKLYNFAVDRISSIEVQREKFDYPDDYHPRDYGEGCFGIFRKEGKPIRVELIFANKHDLKTRKIGRAHV